MKRVEHGMIPQSSPLQSARLEAAYAIHRGNAIIARRRLDTALARYHANQSRLLVKEYARVLPFSPDARRLYLRGGL